MHKPTSDLTCEPHLEPVPLYDLGPASQLTQGVPWFILFEAAWPPNDRWFLF